MKKSDKAVLMIYMIIGAVLVAIGLTIDIDYYSSLIFAMGFALACNSAAQFLRFYHNMKPENREKYREKLRRQSIDLNDERKVQLRNRAGYITWEISMVVCFIAAFVAALFRINAWIVGILFGAAVLQYIVALVIYKYLCRAM